MTRPAAPPLLRPDGVVLLTDRRATRGELVDVVAGAARGGVRWVVLREKDLPRAERAALAVALRAALADTGGGLIVAGPDPLDGDAVHLPAAGPYPPPAVGLVGRSCHDAAELARLTTEDYVTLSPVWPTRSKPGYGPPLRPDGLRDLIRRSPVPVLALGGVETPDQVTACAEAGAVGVAVLGAIMRAADPTAIAAALTSAFPPRRPAGPPPTAPAPATPPAGTDVTGTEPWPTVPTQGSGLTAPSGRGRPQPSTPRTTDRIPVGGAWPEETT
ncbi:thiamine-phosphate pyrophosphorylase [Micromonospora matsumotoense]|uniref:Thiamine-phosphate pyrophosphorylase n=1 Tax=Micromonospora matsumotoense TaxID=121616 RepID=A0A1C4WGF4_9ACTN|nr:thiamine phosphate synthase [Micromonospora matsumotoense]SCE95278.1 thiamine-phosphate pyrophosphorylase [Micromonospora matsumotoense]